MGVQQKPVCLDSETHASTRLTAPQTYNVQIGKKTWAAYAVLFAVLLGSCIAMICGVVQASNGLTTTYESIYRGVDTLKTTVRSFKDVQNLASTVGNLATDIGNKCGTDAIAKTMSTVADKSTEIASSVGELQVVQTGVCLWRFRSDMRVPSHAEKK